MMLTIAAEIKTFLPEYIFLPDIVPHQELGKNYCQELVMDIAWVAYRDAMSGNWTNIQRVSGCGPTRRSYTQ